ncbi:MAG: FAD:protein FMN transferase [Gammaproteobacteria bacterium]|nr:FAD:protein FMN transferase [Gammaproteobacteria bacterium]
MFVTLGASTNAWSEWYKSERIMMGTLITVDIWHDDPKVAALCGQQVFDEMQRIDRSMNPLNDDSDLSNINNNAADHEVKISNEIFYLIEKSLEMSEASEGAFDITFASVGYLYDYHNKTRPTKKNIEDKLSGINYRHIQLDPQNKTIKFKQKNVRLDFGGIAKGYAVDNAIKLLQTCGIKNGLVGAGGDSRVMGDRNGKPWVIGVRHPRDKDKVVVRLPLDNSAISTSGDYERFFIEGSQRYHHIINPKTGTSITNTWSATVIGDDAITTDALSTTLFILGAQKAIEFIESYQGVDAIIIDDKGKMHYSSGLTPPAEPQSAQQH